MCVMRYNEGEKLTRPQDLILLHRTGNLYILSWQYYLKRMKFMVTFIFICVYKQAFLVIRAYSIEHTTHTLQHQPSDQSTNERHNNAKTKLR